MQARSSRARRLTSMGGPTSTDIIPDKDLMHQHGNSQDNERRLLFVLTITAVYLVAEVIAGFLTGSLALLADSGHLLTDVLGLLMAVAAIRFARRPATPGKTYGFYRTEILA